jgi:hypothetical protein
MGQVVVVGLDIAKSVFQVHGVDRDGEVVVRRRLRRSRVLPFFATVEPCRIGMEACASGHYWARELRALGHDVRLMAPSYVKPYVKRQKNDAADAEAICEAVSRPTMRFVAVKILATPRRCSSDMPDARERSRVSMPRWYSSCCPGCARRSHRLNPGSEIAAPDRARAHGPEVIVDALARFMIGDLARTRHRATKKA